MSDLLTPPIPAERLLSGRLRVRMVDGEGLEPELMSRRDYVLLDPVDNYCGEGIYLLDVGAGPVLYRVQWAGGDNVLIRYTNPLYRDNGHLVSREKFDEVTLGIVVADIKIRDERFLREPRL